MTAAPVGRARGYGFQPFRPATSLISCLIAFQGSWFSGFFWRRGDLVFADGRRRKADRLLDLLDDGAADGRMVTK
ncbi:hypothetical protein [Streptomyces sp. NL15-2K]|uniref:hypothetical protein n=1 Tax=Streptomyces sp. NL15-2K TaxID=376149 RepID=UPI000F56A05A|nr:MULTISPECIES: hypothetical protein [Actinomycetes]WKX06483.1 hypothetical protein Q4V64_02850 [Kutzneria buriramensis]